MCLIKLDNLSIGHQTMLSESLTSISAEVIVKNLTDCKSRNKGRYNKKGKFLLTIRNGAGECIFELLFGLHMSIRQCSKGLTVAATALQNYELYVNGLFAEEGATSGLFLDDFSSYRALINEMIEYLPLTQVIAEMQAENTLKAA